MRNLILLFIFTITLISCNNDYSQIDKNITNSVVLLKVDFLTSTFEGGKEILFPGANTFTITHTYHPPGDFGSVQLYYQELNQLLFDGDIIWMGLGDVSYPSTIDLPETFTTVNSNLPLPNLNQFKKVMYDEFAYYPDTIDYSSIWNSISNLEIVNNYLNSNPNGKINLFLYTPSVGIGNPADWDWYIILKN